LNCKQVIVEISNYLDGEIALAVRQELERHLEHCEDCAVVVNQTRMTVEIFCDSEAVELPGDVRSRLHEALRKKIGERGEGTR
jgi:anti-sigma factor RsiW